MTENTTVRTVFRALQNSRKLPLTETDCGLTIYAGRRYATHFGYTDRYRTGTVRSGKPIEYLRKVVEKRFGLSRC